MNKIVVFAEKPSQAKAYTEAFDKVEKKEGYYIVSNQNYKEAIITFGYGHLVELCDPSEYKSEWNYWQIDQLPILPTQFKYRVSKGKEKQYKIVKKLLDSADEIVIATDIDREGEAIARLVINLSGNHNKPLKRLWINSLEIDEIKKGFNNLKRGEYFYYIFKEAESRQIADWLVGINLSRLYTLYMQQNGLREVFSVGRVQTPTLFMIYQRNKEIEEFIKKPYYELFAVFNKDQKEYLGKFEGSFDTQEEVNEFINKYDLENKKGIVSKVETKEKKEYAPSLFSLSDLQTLANNKFSYSADETLKITQSLYEKKILSYPRSSSRYIGTPEFEYLKENLKKYLNIVNEDIISPNLEENKKYVDNKKVQEHYAIIPTKIIPNLNDLEEKEINIYKLVLYRTISIFEEEHIYDETVIETKINKIPFLSKGKHIKNVGWKKFFENIKKEEEEKIESNLPDVDINEMFLSKLEIERKETKPAKPFTEGTLLTAMKNVGKIVEDENNSEILKETEGIGTEATRSSIIETLKKQDYIRLKGKNINVTDKGKILCETLSNTDIINVELTAKWEQYLQLIRIQEGDQKSFIESIARFIKYSIETAPDIFNKGNINKRIEEIEEKNVIGKCPICKENIIDKKNFYGCSGYNKNKCEFTLPKKIAGKSLSKKNIADLLVKGSTTTINGFISKKGSKFPAKLKLEENKIKFVFDNK